MGGQTSTITLPGKILKLIIGIGNPGYWFSNTRHNVGIMLLDRLMKEFNLEKFNTSWGEIAFLKQLDGYVAFFKSNSYMNLSGNSVQFAMELCNISNPNDVVIIHDDLETHLGKTKFQDGGGTKGHRGIKSVIETIKNANFFRIKIGIGRPDSRNSWIVSMYVTSSFSKDEMKILEEQSFPICLDLLKEKKILQNE